MAAVRVLPLLFLLLLLPFTASAKGDGYRRVYIFGVATTFNDSTVVLTEIQAIDSAYVTKGNILPERALYSYQLEYFLETTHDKPGAMVAVYWSTKRKDVEKLFLRVRRRFNDDETTYLQPLPADEFKFMRMEHVE